MPNILNRIMPANPPGFTPVRYWKYAVMDYRRAASTHLAIHNNTLHRGIILPAGPAPLHCSELTHIASPSASNFPVCKSKPIVVPSPRNEYVPALKGDGRHGGVASVTVVAVGNVGELAAGAAVLLTLWGRFGDTVDLC